MIHALRLFKIVLFFLCEHFFDGGGFEVSEGGVICEGFQHAVAEFALPDIVRFGTEAEVHVELAGEPCRGLRGDEQLAVTELS